MANPNKPLPPLRWSIVRAAREFGLSRDTLSRKLSIAKEVADPTGCYSTKQLLAALYGDLPAERLREVRGKADNWELKNGALRGELLSREAITKAGEAFVIAARSLIETSSMTKDERNSLLESLATWPIVVRETAKRQTSQLHLRPEKDAANGNEDGE